MHPPTVTERPLPLEPVSHDPFIDGLAAKSPPPPPPPPPPGGWGRARRRIWD